MTSYEQALTRLGALQPRIAAALGEAEQRRQDKLANLLGGARLAGLEALLVHLDQLAQAWNADRLGSGPRTTLRHVPQL